MQPAIQVRPTDIARDRDDIARIRSACFPDWPVTGAEVADAYVRRPGDQFHEMHIAVDTRGCVLGYGFIEEPSVAARPGRIRIRVNIDPAARRRGAGSVLYAALEQRAVRSGATELVTEAGDDAADAPRFLARYGFVEYHRRLESRLAVADIAPADIARGIDRMTDRFFPSGVRIATYRQLLLAVADAPRRLYDLDATLWADVPFGLTGAVPTFERYQAQELADPDFLPAATFIALDGPRWIGLAALMNGKGFLLNSMTGVTREWRQRGLARWLKLHTLRWALERQAGEIRTFNDAGNDPILALNRSLGFRVASIQARYRKDLL